MDPIIAIRPGRHIDSQGNTREITAEDLRKTASAYNVELHESPITIGHPKHDAPAYGWIKRVEFDGQALKLHPDQVNPEFAELHRSGAFKKHSIALYHPDDARNPAPGTWYPRHIGFLGAQPPAIKGLPNAEFAEGDKPVEIEFSEIDADGLAFTLKGMFRRMRELLIDKFGLEAANETIPDFELEDLERTITRPDLDPDSSANPAFSEGETMTKQTEDQIARQAELDRRQAKIEADEQRIAAAAAESRRKAAVEFSESLAASGRILPGHQGRVAEIMQSLDGDQVAEIEFSEGKETIKRAPVQAFRELMESLPKAIDFSEKSGDDTVDQPFNFSAPSGSLVDPERAKLHARAKAHQAKHGCTFSEAVSAVEFS